MRPQWQLMAQGPRRASASTHRAAPGWGTSRSRCTRDTGGGCRDSRKTHSLHVVGGREIGTECQVGFGKCAALVSLTNGGCFVFAPTSRGQLSLALSVLPLRTLFIGVNAR